MTRTITSIYEWVVSYDKKRKRCWRCGKIDEMRHVYFAHKYKMFYLLSRHKMTQKKHKLQVKDWLINLTIEIKLNGFKL